MDDSEDVPTELARGKTNAVGRALGLLGDEWSLLIIQRAVIGATRYGDFLSQLPISNAVLTGRLQALTKDGILDRVVYQTNPKRSEYHLTARSRSLWPLLVSIWDWERNWVPQHAQVVPALRHSGCGQDCSPVLQCAFCGAVTTSADLDARWGPSGSWPRSVPASANRRRPGTGESGSAAGLFPQTMSVFGNKWSAALLIAAFLGATRFNEFESNLQAPPASIAERLKVFRANGILEGTGEYRLTEKGRAFLPVLISALQWGQRWYRAPEGDAVELTHRPCGERFTGVLACDKCGDTLTGAQVSGASPEPGSP